MTHNASPPSLEGDLSSGELIAGRYEILKLLGVGGMGAVYLVEDRVLSGDAVAMKVLHRQFAHDPKYSQRFLREVQLMRKVNHNNVVRTYDVGADGDLMYFTMEFVPGLSLIDWASGHSVARDTLLNLLKQICEGLKAIHDAGIVHRDLKPDNIIIVGDGTIKIADFGVARPQNSELTAHNEIIGSANYMAPEVWLGEPITASIDLYALGVILYELATGQLPFEGDTPAAMMRLHLDRTPTPPRNINPGIPIWLNRLVLSLLEKRPHQRFKSADEILDFLRQVEVRERPGPRDVKVHTESVSLLTQLEAQSTRTTNTRNTIKTKHSTKADRHPLHSLLVNIITRPLRWKLTSSAKTLADFNQRSLVLHHAILLLGLVGCSVLPALAALSVAGIDSIDGMRWQNYLHWLSQAQDFTRAVWVTSLVGIVAATSPFLFTGLLSRGLESFASVVLRMFVVVFGLATLIVSIGCWDIYIADSPLGDARGLFNLWVESSVWLTNILMLSPQVGLESTVLTVFTKHWLAFELSLLIIAWGLIVPGGTADRARVGLWSKRLFWVVVATASSFFQLSWLEQHRQSFDILIGSLAVNMSFLINWVILGWLTLSLNSASRNSSTARTKKR